MFRFPQLIINAESNEFASNMPAKQAKGGRQAHPEGVAWYTTYDMI